MDELVFLKLGGSLITEKTKRFSPRLQKLGTLAAEIRSALREMPHIRLLLGHGSGSFGHYAVQQHLRPDTFRRDEAGASRGEDSYWRGFSEVWFQASQLNRHVMDTLHKAGIPAVSLPPSASVTTSDGAIGDWDLKPLRAGLQSGLLPVVFGDIVFDSQQGGKVLSTESLMVYLARELGPRRILLAGLEAAVWADFPTRNAPLVRITPATLPTVAARIGASHGPDVTGGMWSKVTAMLELVQAVPGLSVDVFSGEEPGNVRRALVGAALGTRITSD
jgi:isopentenyl phosphate kinase